MLAAESTNLQWATFIAAAIGGVAALVVVIVYSIQTYIMNQTRIGTSVIEAVKWMQSDEMRQRREEVYKLEITPLTPAQLNDNAHEGERDSLETVADSLNTLAYMANHRMIPKKIVLGLWAPAYARCWPLAKPWVEFRRGGGKEHQGLWRDFQTLAEEVQNAGPIGH